MSSAGRMEGGRRDRGERCAGLLCMCYVVSLLCFPFLKVSPVPSPSLSLAGGACACVCVCVCVCVSYCENCCASVSRSLSWDWTRTNEMEHRTSPGDKPTTQLPETLRHMPSLQVKIKITQEQSFQRQRPLLHKNALYLE